MDAGLVAEIGPPSVLLANPNSAFSKLVDKTGAASAAALRKMASDFLAEVRLPACFACCYTASGRRCCGMHACGAPCLPPSPPVLNPH